ncbi:hypothetical protein SAMN05216323_11345, partial [Williamwhitmania taraxaci]
NAPKKVAQLRPKRLAQLEPKWVAQLRPFYLGGEQWQKNPYDS